MLRINSKIILALVMLLLPLLAPATSGTQSFIRDLALEIRQMLQSGNVEQANQIFVNRFDITKFAKLTLIDHWGEFSAEERERFIDLLGKNLQKSVRERSLFTSEDIDFDFITKEIVHEKSGKILFKNLLKIKKGDFKLVITAIRSGNEYKIVDYEVEGALLSRNYRGHFNYIIRKYGKSGLFGRLEKKLSES